MSDYFRPVTKQMRDVLVMFLADAEEAGKRQPFGTIKALRVRGLLIGNVLTPPGLALAVEIRRTRDREQRWKDRY